MTDTGLNELRDTYQRDGFVSGVEILSESEVLRHRTAMEIAEASFGPLHYEGKVHTILRSPHELATISSVLDIVEQVIGPNILLHSATYIIKEPGSGSFVSWHQDLTYWGFSHDDQVSMWLALSPATVESGCMRMIPGSHQLGQQHHILGEQDENNVLFQSQRVADIDESKAISAELKPGQASFHHGWLLHASSPNTSADRRIGLNIQYIAPHVRQTKLPGFTALLVRGVDQYQHYNIDVAATSDLDRDAMQQRDDLERLHRGIAGRA